MSTVSTERRWTAPTGTPAGPSLPSSSSLSPSPPPTSLFAAGAVVLLEGPDCHAAVKISLPFLKSWM